MIILFIMIVIVIMIIIIIVIVCNSTHLFICFRDHALLPLTTASLFRSFFFASQLPTTTQNSAVSQLSLD